MAYMKDSKGRRLEDFEVSDVADIENPKTGTGLLAYAENVTGTGTQVLTSGAAVGVAFCVINIEPSEREVFISWEVRTGISVAPGGTYGGAVAGVVWEVTMSGASPVVVEMDRDPVRVYPTDPTNIDQGKARGDFRVGPSANRRTYALGAVVTKENAAGTLQGLLRNASNARSKLQAEAR